MKKYKYILFIFAIALVSHLQWFNPFSILNSSDWSYWPNEAVSQLYNSYGVWVNFFNFGVINIQLPFNFFILIWSLLANFGLSYDFATKVTFLIPIAILGFVSPYILFKKLTKNELISFVVALFYGTTPYFLIRQTAHLPVALIYAIAPLIIFCFIKALEKNKLVNWLTFVLIYWICICYEIRITYIVTFILFAYFVFFNILNLKKFWKNIFICILITIGLNLFWLLPTILSGSLGNITTIADRGLFGSFLFSLEHAFNIYDSNWTGGLIVPFIKQPIIIYFWLIPLMAFSGFLSSNLIYRKKIIFFGVISLIGIFLTKQAVEPLIGAYLWLYNNFPGFNLFREASKFYLLTAIGYMGLIGYGLLALKEHKNKILNKYLFYAFSIFLITISLWNLQPLVTGEIRTMFIPKYVPSDYLIFKDFILEQNEFFRTFGVPTNSRWSIYTNQKPKISNVSVIGGNWNNFIEKKNANEKIIQNRIVNVFKLQFADRLFDISSIKYVIVPTQDIANDADIFIYYGGADNPNIRDWYIAELDKISWLKKINIGTSELVVYENENYKAHIYSDTGLNYSQSKASEFGDFSQNQNLYLNSDIEKNKFILDKLDNVIVPIEADSVKIAAMKLIVDKTVDAKEKKKLQSDLDLYAKNLFFKDYKFNIPIKAKYKIYLKTDSVLANNKNIRIQLADKILQQNAKSAEDKDGWKYFSQIELEKGEHTFNLYIGTTLVDAINAGDIVLSAENLAEPIKTPQLEYKQINPTKYIVNVHGASESFPLIFSESFHPDWKIYIQPALFTQVTGNFISENNQGSIQNENLYGGTFYDLLFRKSVSDDRHLLINGFANAWWIDLVELEKQGKIIKNADNTYDFSVYIEFEPQKFFYIGLLVSALTLLACLIYLLANAYHWYTIKKVKKVVKIPL